MAISPVGATDQSAFGLDFQSLLKIILTLITYQDPLKPVDNFQFVSQLAQFSQLQQSQTLNDQITALLTTQSTNQATALLGRTVAVESQGQQITGVVQSISLSTGTPQFTVRTADGSLIPNVAFGDIVTIRQ